MMASKPIALSDVARKLWLGLLEDLIAGQTDSRYSPFDDLVIIR
jgi:hypothetical protein